MKNLFLFFSRTLRRVVPGWCIPAIANENVLTAAGIQPCLAIAAEAETQDTLVGRIVNLMEVEKLFKNPYLDLKQLSERLDTPAYLVTRAINERLRVNFNDLVNRYRVEEVKNLLLLRDCRRFTLMSIAADAGFNSKTTFNTVFKKNTGVTPSYFRDQCCRSQKRSTRAHQFVITEKV
jgi:AraC-like DNA-binding protein